jgi:dUTP pyrophosphatase
MKIEVLKNDTYNNVAVLPKTATERSTGYDIIATSDPEIVGKLHGESKNVYESIDYIQYKTNLKIAVQKDRVWTGGITSPLDIDYDVLAMPRSSVSKYNLVLANSIGLIDADYRGEILVRFKYVWQPEDFIYVPTSDGNKSSISSKIVGTPNLDKIYKKDDKICQLKITKVEHVEFYLVDVLDTTQRGEGGFGSTDATPTPIVPDKTLVDMIKNYIKNPVYTPEKKYSDLMKEKESKL